MLQGPTQSDDPDELHQMMLEAMRAQAVDLSQAIPVQPMLGFSSQQAARDAGAELQRAGYPSLRMGTGQIPNIVATVQLVLTVDSLRSLRLELTGFANARQGDWLGSQVGGLATSPALPWGSPGADQSDQTEAEADDQMVVDQLFAWDLELKQQMAITSGLGFMSSDSAREAAAALFAGGYLEVHVVAAGSGWVVESVVSMAPKLDALRNLRLGLTGFADARGAAGRAFKSRLHCRKKQQRNDVLGSGV